MIKKIINILFPKRESENKLNPNNIFMKYEKSCENLVNTRNEKLGSELIQIAKFIYIEENNRRHRIDRTATTLLSSITFVVALIVTLSGIAFSKNTFDFSITNVVILGLYFITLVYLCAASLKSLSVFSYVSRFCIDPTDIDPSNVETIKKYNIRLGARFIEYTIENYKINNRELNKIHVARDLLRNAIAALLLSGLLIVIKYTFTSINGNDSYKMKTEITKTYNVGLHSDSTAVESEHLFKDNSKTSTLDSTSLQSNQ